MSRRVVLSSLVALAAVASVLALACAPPVPEEAELLPTHGAGSFCSSQQCGGERRAPLHAERLTNVVLASPDFEAFRAQHLGNPAPIPGYGRIALLAASMVSSSGEG